MTIDPRSTDEIYVDIQTYLTSTIDRITNFVSNSFNDAFIQSYSEQLREAEIKALAGELAGYADYAGKELTQNDLDELGITGVSPEEINPYMDPEQLDRLADNYNIEREEGTRASGTVVVEVSDDSVTVEEGFLFGTQPDSGGEYNAYEVIISDQEDESDDDEDPYVTPDPDEDTVEVSIRATEPGPDYNTPVDTITYIINPEPGIQSVTNPDVVAGGEEGQDNASLREDIKNSDFISSRGGTREGLISHIESNTEGDVTVETEEHTSECPVFVDVVVDGGDRIDLEGLIEEARPVGIEHNLVRPTTLDLGSTTDLVGFNVDTSDVEESIVNYLSGLGLGETFSWSSLLNQVITSDSGIETVPVLNNYVVSVDRELVTYNEGQDLYELDQAPLGIVEDEEHYYDVDTAQYELLFDDIDTSSVEVVAMVSGQEEELVQDLDFTVESLTTDDEEITVVEISSDAGVDDGSVMEVTYEHASVGLDHAQVVDGDELFEGSHIEIVDTDGDGLYDSIEIIDHDRVEDGERIEVSYDAGTRFEGDLQVDNRQQIDVDPSRIIVEVYQ